MYKKRLITITASLLLTFSCLAGCGEEEERMEVKEPEIVIIDESGTVEPEGAEAPVEEPVELTTAYPVVSEERESVNGQIQSYLTGQWINEGIATRRPIAVMIPNNKPAMPQYGLSKAAVIYEAPVEGRITRLMAIFEDFDELDRIGPIRSSRDYFLYTAMGFEAIYCNWGLAVPYVEELINRDDVYNVSAAVTGIHNPADEAYSRVSRPGYATEFTGYLMIDGLMKAVDRLGYDWNYDDAYVRPFLFAADGIYADYAANESATMIYPGGESGSNSSGYGSYHPYFEYHEDDHLYYRYQEGKKQIDEYTGNQLTVSNVIFQYCHGEVRDDHDYLAFGVHGEGEAIVFTNGKVIRGTWKRLGGDFTPALFYDENGDEIILNQGATWICNIWDEYSEFIEWK
ncbi:MAG: DUF3048 domain-containing protein [Blautia sp.]|nr:DUF3048 domain-containing protein [Blautia sp.]MCM1201307.1 DUF3048 domain-containing protein [Bacteroides fragilis]